jgi:hypothetical protein
VAKKGRFVPLSWNEIKDRALSFSRERAQVSSEDAEAKSFWDGFFNIFGKKTYASDAERVAFLFEQYQKLTSMLPVEKKKRKKST